MALIIQAKHEKEHTNNRYEDAQGWLLSVTPIEEIHFEAPRMSDSESPMNRDSSNDQEDSEDEEEEDEDEDSQVKEWVLSIQIPLLFVDVNLGKGVMKRIILYEGDDPKYIAEMFAKDNNLEQNMRNKLERLLKKQMDGVLAKIEEDEEDEDSAHS